MESGRTRVLFVAEGATLAHVGRPLQLARSLDPETFDISFARPEAFAWLTREERFPLLPLRSQDSSIFARRLDAGRPLYDFATLVAYVEEDLALLAAAKPDVVVGDFRLSLSVSARLAGTPYATICDAYWSPETPLRPQLPVLWHTRYAPLGVAKLLFRWVAPYAFRLHARPMEQLRARYGLPPLGGDLRRCYTDADLRLFANFRMLFPETDATPAADFLGPLAWSPPDDPGLEATLGSEPLIYVTMGSSGDPGALAQLLPALAETGLPVAVAGAGKTVPSMAKYPANVRVFDFLPGDQMCRRARLVVCNGGSPTTNQALRAGVPVLGICRNMDQFLNMNAVEAFGAGLGLRSDRLDPASLRSRIAALLSEPSYGAQAKKLQRTVGQESAFATYLERLVTPRLH